MRKYSSVQTGFLQVLFVIFCLLFSAVSNIRAEESTLIMPTHTGKTINTGTVTAIDSNNRLLLVNTADYGVITIKSTVYTILKEDTSYIDFEDIKVNDYIGFDGYWSGVMVEANDIAVLQESNMIGGFKTVTYTPFAPVIHTGYTPSASLANLYIQELIIRKGEDKVNLRVNLSNSSSKPIHEYFAVKLYIRENSLDSYSLLNTWEEEHLNPYNYLSRDFFLYEPTPYLPAEHFQVKAELLDGAGNVFYIFEQTYNGEDII